MIKNDMTDTLKTALAKLEGMLPKAGSPQQAEHEQIEKEWLKVAKELGAAPIPVPADKLVDSLRAILAAESYSPQQLKLGDITLPVHNEQVAKRLKPEYTPAQFKELFDFCEKNGVFSIKIDEANGLVETATVEENWGMSGRRWVTDTVRCGDIEKVVAPKAWLRALITLADFYTQDEELAAIEEAVKDANFYREGGLTNGIAHIFLPETLKRDSTWFNNKRLESHALALSAFCQMLASAEPVVKDQQQSALLTDAKPRSKMVNAISNLATYFKVINTNPDTGAFDFAAPSAGPWEEVPFADGLTWDICAMLVAFTDLRTLLFAEELAGNEQIKTIRSEMISTKHGAWLKNIDTLDKLIASANQKMADRLFGSEEPMEHPIRPFDSSSAFIVTSGVKLANTNLADAKLHCRLLESLERHLVKDNGMIRYSPFDLPTENGKNKLVFDSYLADNYWLAVPLRSVLTGQQQPNGQEFGSEDCSSTEAYLERVKMARPNTEAQWCWVSVMAEGYARQTVKILKDAGDRRLTADEDALVSKSLTKATQFINRSYARITGQSTPDNPIYKSNGKQCPPFAVPEAYEHVGLIEKSGATAILPGVNTPLAWGVASLFSASQWFADALELAKKRRAN
jgi:hypothetical protein